MATEKPTARKQVELLNSYARLLCKIYKEVDPLVGFKDSSEIGMQIRYVQTDLFNLYSSNKNLVMYKYFNLDRYGRVVIHMPYLTVSSFLLGQLMYHDQSHHELSVVSRILSLTNNDYPPAYCVNMVREMIIKGALKWLGLKGDPNPDISLTKRFMTDYYSVDIGYESHFKVKQKPIQNSLYGNRFSIRFPEAGKN